MIYSSPGAKLVIQPLAGLGFDPLLGLGLGLETRDILHFAVRPRHPHAPSGPSFHRSGLERHHLARFGHVRAICVGCVLGQWPATIKLFRGPIAAGGHDLAGGSPCRWRLRLAHGERLLFGGLLVRRHRPADTRRSRVRILGARHALMSSSRRDSPQAPFGELRRRSASWCSTPG